MNSRLERSFGSEGVWSMEEELRIQLRTVEDSVLVRVEDDIDVITADRLRQALDKAIATAGACVEVDLASVTFFGVDGINTLLAGRQQACGRSVDQRIRHW